VNSIRSDQSGSIQYEEIPPYSADPFGVQYGLHLLPPTLAVRAYHRYPRVSSLAVGILAGCAYPRWLCVSWRCVSTLSARILAGCAYPLRAHHVVLYTLSPSVVLCALTPPRAYPVCDPLRAHPWAFARSPRGPLCAHPVVLYVLRPWFPKRSTRLWSSVHSPRGPLHADPVGVCGPLRAHPLVFYVLLPWFPNRSTRLESSAHSGLTPVIVCALTPSVVRCTLTRGPLRAHPVCDPLRLRAVVPVVLDALTPSEILAGCVYPHWL